MNILIIIGSVIALFGVILIYDARSITKKVFGFGDQNERDKRIKNSRLYIKCYRSTFNNV